MALRTAHTIQSTYLFLALFICATLLLAVSSNTRYLATVEIGLRFIVQPITYIANLPHKATEQIGYYFDSVAELQLRNDELELNLSQLSATTAELDQAKATIAQLQTVLGASAPIQAQHVLAEIVYVNPSRQRQEVTINVGLNQGVTDDNGVLDPWGVFGQTVEVFPNSSRVLLANDERHATPVLVKRTRRYFVASGNGPNELLTLDNVNLSADVQIGDEVVTSGLGGIFPEGLNVGVIVATNDIVAESIKHVTVAPHARPDAKSYLRVIVMDSVRE
ncbi:MAG: rod shape-determining protein MreC [Gammaproteobacteria bacterium]|nr:rod shape-determining protein MreC [Gammaproteobacteria bacterium]